MLVMPQAGAHLLLLVLLAVYSSLVSRKPWLPCMALGYHPGPLHLMSTCLLLSPPRPVNQFLALRAHWCSRGHRGALLQELWALIMDAGTAYTAQTYNLTAQFLPKEWIMEKWEEGFYITAMAGSNSGWSLVAMSKGTPYTQQSYKVCSGLL